MAGNGDEPDFSLWLLAASVNYSADRRLYRFTLRPEAAFADGSKLTAADVAFSLATLKTKGHPLYAALLAEVESVAAEAKAWSPCAS